MNKMGITPVATQRTPSLNWIKKCYISFISSGSEKEIFPTENSFMSEQSVVILQELQILFSKFKLMYL